MNEPNPNAISASPKAVARRQTVCNFCGRSSEVAGAMVEGPGDVYICADCVEIAYGILLQQRARQRIWPDRDQPLAHGG